MFVTYKKYCFVALLILQMVRYTAIDRFVKPLLPQPRSWASFSLFTCDDEEKALAF